MDRLNSNWITEGHIDFEYKKYILLAYLQSVSKHFDEKRIYPFLSELVSHYRNLETLRSTKTAVEQSFPKHISRLDLERFKIHYERAMHDAEQLQVIAAIIDFALPRLQSSIGIAREIYDMVEDNLKIHAVGIVPLQTDEGYLLFRPADTGATSAFYYELTVFEHAADRFRGIKTQFIEEYPMSVVYYDEAIKSDLIRKNRQLPNPATYVIESRVAFPFSDTLFPVARRVFVRYIEQQRA